MLEENDDGSDRMIKWLLAAVMILLILCVAEWMRELITFQVTHYNITSEKLRSVSEEVKLVFLSDLHNCSYGAGNARLLNAVRDAKPDLILVGGDMLIGKAGADQSVAVNLMIALAKTYPVYYANGNHEQRMKEYPEEFGTTYAEYKKALTEEGVIFLENEQTDLHLANTAVCISGLEIPPECYAKFQKTSLSLEEVRDRIGQADGGKYQILLAHNPKFMDTYLAWGADLVLSGHLHGGVVRIPGFGGLITPQGNLFPKYSGEYTRTGGKSVVVSRGLGTHTIRLRFLNPAEMIVLHLHGAV